MLERANQLASCVLKQNSHCWLVQAEPDYGDAANDADAYGTIAEHRLNFEFEYPPSDDECGFRIFAAPVIWSDGAFNDLIAKLADDELRMPTMWVSLATGAAFAPYDGGTDLFLSTSDEVAKLRREFADWLSDHPEGL